MDSLRAGDAVPSTVLSIWWRDAEFGATGGRYRGHPLARLAIDFDLIESCLVSMDPGGWSLID